jgi:hypothetical protein
MKEVRSQKPEARTLRLVGFACATIICVLALLSSCKLKNELYDNTDQPIGNGAGNLPRVVATNPLLADILLDDDTLADGIQSTVAISFNDYMSPAGMTAQNVAVTNTSTGQPVAGLALSYSSGGRTFFIRGDNWPSNSAYLVTLASGAVGNLQGTPLDGNSNERSDGAPYDDFLTTFYTSGSGSANCVPTVPPRIASISPDTGRTDTALPEIRVNFTLTQLMDTTTLKDPNNLTLTSASGTALPLILTQVNAFTLAARPASPLPKGQVYQVSLACKNIKAAPSSGMPEFLRTLDGDANGAGGVEPDYRWYFLCDSLEPPSVDSAVWIENRVQIDFLQLMDTASLGNGAIRIFDEQGYVPGDIHYSVTYEGVSRAEYYFQRAVSGFEIRLQLSHLVKSVNGLMLDSNGNGVGGETTDDYRAVLTPF